MSRIDKIVFSGYIMCLVQQNLKPLFKDRGYNVLFSEPKNDNGLETHWDLKVVASPSDLTLTTDDERNAVLEVKCRENEEGHFLKVKSNHVDFEFLLLVNQTLGIQNMKQLSIQDKHPELVELIETFFKEAGVVMIKDAKNIP